MVQNEKGSALLTVLLMMLVFTILGVSIISASIGGAKRTEVRETEIETDLSAIKAVNEGIAYIKYKINDQYDKNTSIRTYNEDIIQSIFEDLDENALFEIKDATSEYVKSNPNYKGSGEIDTDEDFTKVFDVSAQAYSGKYYTQRLYVTAMPSFLKYALGADNNLTMNGSVNIKNGDVFAGGNLYISNMARYILGTPKMVNTHLSKTNSNSFLEVYGDIFYCKSGDSFGRVVEQTESTNCYNNGGENNGRSGNWIKDVNFNQDLLFQQEGTKKSPTLYSSNENFVKVIIPETVIDKLSPYVYLTLTHEDLKNLQFSMFNNKVVEIDDKNENGYYDTSAAIPERTNYIKGAISDWIYIEPNVESEPLFQIKKGEWLIVDGNAYIENVRNDFLNIDANIIVTGNLRIKGNVNFNSTMYVIGDVDVIDANIRGYGENADNGEDDDQKGELILMNEGKLRIGKINSFAEPDEGEYELKAYFYTARNAELYAVGSLIEIKGGLFAGGILDGEETEENGNLEVNSFRGSTKFEDQSIKPIPKNDYQLSRLSISNEKKLFINQAQGLPRVDKLEFIVDPIKKHSK